MSRLRFAVSVAGLVTIASALVQAQEPDTVGASQRTGLTLARLRVGQWVRVRTHRNGFVEGWISNSPNLVTLRAADGSMIDVPASGVASLRVRHGSHARTGALIGGAVAGIGLGVLTQGFSTAEGGCNEPGYGSGCGPGPFFVGFLVGGAGGALAGALIGVAVPRWQYQAGFVLARLQVGQRVRIRTNGGGGGFVEGWISNSPNFVTLRTALGSTIAVPAPGVDSLWVRGTHAGRGALIGGAVAGIGLGAFLASHVNQNNPYNARNTVAGGLGLVGGGAVGALVGALIGAASPRWQLRVP